MDGCSSSSLEHMFCHGITSRLSPTDFLLDVSECQYSLSYRDRKLLVLDHTAPLIESMDNQPNLLGGWGDEEGDESLS